MYEKPLLSPHATYLNLALSRANFSRWMRRRNLRTKFKSDIHFAKFSTCARVRDMHETLCANSQIPGNPEVPAIKTDKSKIPLKLNNGKTPRFSDFQLALLQIKSSRCAL